MTMEVIIFSKYPNLKSCILFLKKYHNAMIWKYVKFDIWLAWGNIRVSHSTKLPFFCWSWNSWNVRGWHVHFLISTQISPSDSIPEEQSNVLLTWIDVLQLEITRNKEELSAINHILNSPKAWKCVLKNSKESKVKQSIDLGVLFVREFCVLFSNTNVDNQKK